MRKAVKLDEASGASKIPALTGPVQGHPHQLLRKRELAAIVSVSERTIDGWVARKLIPYVRLSARMTRYSLASVLVALERYEVKEVGATA
jgi:predicted DNA-binding transcriptional regulator AlpA